MKLSHLLLPVGEFGVRLTGSARTDHADLPSRKSGIWLSLYSHPCSLLPSPHAQSKYLNCGTSSCIYNYLLSLSFLPPWYVASLLPNSRRLHQLSMCNYSDSQRHQCTYSCSHSSPKPSSTAPQALPMAKLAKLKDIELTAFPGEP